VTDEEKKDLLKFDSPIGRDKANTSISQSLSIFESFTSHTPAKEVHFEFTRTFPFSHFPMTRNEFAGSFNYIISVSLHHLRHAGIYSADCRGMWTRSTVIIANTDDRLGEHWEGEHAFYIDEHGTGTYFELWLTLRSKIDFDETPPCIDHGI